MSRRDQFIKDLKEMIQDEENMATGGINEIIYIIDDLVVYGDFYDGIRNADHNVLLFDEMTWEDLILWGTVVVPENKTYISDEINDELEYAGFDILATNNNHIIKSKEPISLNDRLDTLIEKENTEGFVNEQPVLKMER